jgi:hypothetical protein
MAIKASQMLTEKRNIILSKQKLKEEDPDSDKEDKDF